MSQFFQDSAIWVLIIYLAGGVLLATVALIARGRVVKHQRSALFVAALILPPIIGYFLVPDGKWIPVVCALPFVALGLFSIQTIRRIGSQKTLETVLPENVSPEIREIIESSPPVDGQAILAEYIVIAFFSFTIVCLFGLFFLFSLLG